MSDRYEKWLQATAKLRQAKTEELKLRNEICDELLKEKLEGSITTHPPGYKVVSTAKLTRTINREVLEAIWEDLTDEEKECIDYKPSLKLANYRAIENGVGGKLMEAITVKPAQASLKVYPEEAL